MTQLSQILKSALIIIVVVICTDAKSNAMLFDTCTTNDDCVNAIIFQNVESDGQSICISGCNEFASPETIISNCDIDDFPTVWYELNADGVATILNIEVTSTDFDAPTITLFRSTIGCSALELWGLTNSGLTCVVGSGGVAKAIGTEISPSTTYYIAISSLNSIGGDFEICVSTITDGSRCVISRDLQVVARSFPGPLEGPFNPGETVSICLNVNEYTSIDNGCQWFQGIVPVFGNGWDPAFFDANGQPLNATVNGNPMGVAENGNYGTAIWDWFTNVGYHHPNPRLNVVDFDNNGRMELCNSDYESDCEGLPGISGGCCNPCWDTAGTILPPGWFAYGINGSCNIPGPPIAVDWGDGNTCGGVMGPWSFCFDLVTRETPDCLGDSTKNDLSIGYHTFADGETGAWTGDASVCAFDQPLKLSLNALCGRVMPQPDEHLPAINDEDIFTYQIYHDSVSNWEWNITPFNAMPHVINHAENGFIIQNEAVNNGDEPINVKMIFVGHIEGTQDILIKKVFFQVNPWTTGVNAINSFHNLSIFPNPTKKTATIEWPEGDDDVQLTIYNTQGRIVENIQIASTSLSRYAIDMANYAQGLYFVMLSTGNRTYRAKLLKN